jgi:hypothetical protein
MHRILNGRRSGGGEHMINDTSLRSRFLQAVDDAGLAEHSEALLGEARECVHFFYDEPKGELAPGASKVGGLPDLPDSVEWPAGTDDEGRPAGRAEFLAQFNLAEVPAVHGLALPKSGYLWVFVRATRLTHTRAAIIYHDAGEPLRPRPKPAADWVPEYGWRDVDVAALTFRSGVSLPLSSRPFQQRFRKHAYRLGRVRSQLGRDQSTDDRRKRIGGQIGGYSYQAEFDLAREYAIRELGHPEFAQDDPSGYAHQFMLSLMEGAEGEDPSIDDSEPELLDHLPGVRWILENNEKIQATADALQLLFMFRPDHRIDLDFGSGMHLDLLLHRDAMARLDFSNVYCALPMLL